MVDKRIKSITDTTYEVEMPSGDKVEIGNKEAIDFKPHLKLNRWGGECFIKVGLPTNAKITPIIEGNKIKWLDQDVEVDSHPLEPRTVLAKDKDGRDMTFEQLENGGFEFEVILKKKPASNKIIFDIETQGLKFYYQHELTAEEIAGGAFRPDNIVGSYAVYHATRGNIHRGEVAAEKYKCGKAFHIYRPIIEDALSNKAWCSIQFDKYIDPTSLTLTIPQQFLDEATYPVTVDPDFGYDTAGSKKERIARGQLFCRRVGNFYVMPAPGGTANWIKAYIGSDDPEINVTDCKALINQKDSGGAGVHAQIAVGEILDCTLDFHWEQFNLSGEALTGGVSYILNILGDKDSIVELGQDYYVKYDTGDNISYKEDETSYYAVPSNPWVVTPVFYYNYSIYCNYTEGEWPPVGLENKSANMAAKMVAVGLI